VRSHSVDIRAPGGLSVAKKQKKGENNSTNCQLAKPVAHRGIINQSRRALAVPIRLGRTVAAKILTLLG
jgi:hypothetical protein